jgi:Outer membrane protein beta-barrel domain
MTCHTRWYVVPMVAALAGAPLRHADAQSISFGVLAGASLSTFTGDLSADIKNNTGFIAGGFVRLSAVGFSVQPGLYYTTKGASSADFPEATGVHDFTKLDYIKIPIVIRIHVGPLYVGAGPAIGIKLSCTNTLGPAATATTADCPDAVGAKSTEITGILEAGFEFGKFSIGGRADIGITNAIEAIQAGSTANVTYKTQTLSAVAAIRF